MPTSKVKKSLFLTFEVAAKCQNMGYTQRSYRLISLNQPKSSQHTVGHMYIFIIKKCLCDYLCIQETKSKNSTKIAAI